MFPDAASFNGWLDWLDWLDKIDGTNVQHARTRQDNLPTIATHEVLQDQHRALLDQESDRSPPRPSSHTMTSSSPTPSDTMTTPETYRSPHRLSSHTMTSSSSPRRQSHTMTTQETSSSPRRASRGAVEAITPRSSHFNVRITLDQRDHEARERSQLLRRERQHQCPRSRPRSSTPRSSLQQAASTSSTRTHFRPVS